MLSLNEQQVSAFDALTRFFQDKEKDVFILAGLAGTGKTTVIAAFVNSLVESGVSSSRIAICAYTGKATTVLNRKLRDKCPVVATTIHKLLYSTPVDGVQLLANKIDQIELVIDAKKAGSATGPTVSVYDAVTQTEAVVGVSSSLEDLRALREEYITKMNDAARTGGGLKFSRRLPEEIHDAVDIIIVDEASMVDEEIAQHLAETGVPTVYVGDYNQLPPVGKPFGVDLRRPDARLTQIMRQAGDSDIITVAHEILKLRKMPAVVTGKVGVSRVKSTNPLSFITPSGDVPQYITFYNKSRHAINRAIRRHVHKVSTDYNNHVPFIGETVMLDANLPEKRMMKGDLLTVKKVAVNDNVAFRVSAALGVNAKGEDVTPTYRATLELEDAYGTVVELNCFLNDLMLSMGHPQALDPFDDKREILRRAAGTVSIMYPYAITCYKAQGSEWPRVVLMHETPKNDLYLPYIYTGATRARDELIVAG